MQAVKFQVNGFELQLHCTLKFYSDHIAGRVLFYSIVYNADKKVRSFVDLRSTDMRYCIIRQ